MIIVCYIVINKTESAMIKMTNGKIVDSLCMLNKNMKNSLCLIAVFISGHINVNDIHVKVQTMGFKLV